MQQGGFIKMLSEIDSLSYIIFYFRALNWVCSAPTELPKKKSCILQLSSQLQ